MIKTKSTTVSLKNNTLLNFALNQGKRIEKVIKKLAESKSMTEKEGNRWNL